MVRFDRLMWMHNLSVNVDVKANVIRTLLSKGQHIVASEDGTVGGILVPKDTIRNARAREQALAIRSNPKEGMDSVSGFPVLAYDAANEAECSRKAIHDLVAKGILSGKKANRTLWIDRVSLTTFTERHVSMLSIARRIGRYMPTLMNYCNRRKIYMLFVRDGVGQRRQGFVHREDVGKIIKGAKMMLGGYSAGTHHLKQRG